MANETRNVRKTRTGVVVSDAMDKTVVVSVERRITHPVYGKIMRRSKKYYAHDENNEAKKGDKVSIEETRPLSKTKRWRLVEVVSRANGNEVAKSVVLAPGFFLPERLSRIDGEALFGADELPAGVELRVSVTPRDCYGAEGTPVVSASVLTEWK